MIRFLLSRIGCLLVMAGSIVLLLGIAAEGSGQPAFDFIFGGSALLLIGFLMWHWLRPKRHRKRRFSIFRKRDKQEQRERVDGWQEDDYD